MVDMVLSTDEVRMAKRPYDSRDRRMAYELYCRVMDFLNDGEYDILLLKMFGDRASSARYDVDPANVGMICPGEMRIYADFREDLLATIVHECLHGILPRRSEKGVQRLEKLVMRHLTSRQAMRLFVAAANRMAL